MASQGPNSPASATSDSGNGGTVVWSSPTNAGASDNSYASAAAGASALTHWLKVTNFGFSIPTGATIDGIIVEVERKSSAATALADSTLQIVQGGTPGGTNHADSGIWWPTSDTVKSYGSASDLWGLSWSASDINDTGFGFVLDCFAVSAGTATVDHVRITVHYTEGGARLAARKTLLGVG